MQQIETRISLLFMYSTHAKLALCEVGLAMYSFITEHQYPVFISASMQFSKLGWMHPRYVYLLPGWYHRKWWVPVEGDGVNCTEKEMEEMVEHSLTITHDSHQLIPVSSRVLI